MIFLLKQEILMMMMCLSTTIAQACSKVTTRREIRELSDTERSAYFNAIKKLHTGKGGKYEKYTRWHMDYVPHAHGVPGFFPWHRQFILNYERDLQRIDPSVVLPYWDWTRDSQHPERSVVLSDSYIGGEGRKVDHCVVSGPFANWNSTIPDRHCLKRNFEDGKIPPWTSPEVLEAIIEHTPNYSEFRSIIESPVHGTVHNGIGGIGGDMSDMQSPNDPVFFLHHAFIDLIWNEWQQRHSVSSYGGGQVHSSDIMPPFNRTVRAMFKTTDHCYNYPRFSATLPKITENSLIGSPGYPSHHNNGTFDDVVPPRSRPFHHLRTYIESIGRNPNQFLSPTPDNLVSDLSTKIQLSQPLPEIFIRQNRLDKDQVRENERIINQLVHALNGIPGFKTSAINSANELRA